MNKVIGDAGWLFNSGFGVGWGLECVFVCLKGKQRARSDAGMLHLLDNPVYSVINHTHYWNGDGSALIKASMSLLRAFVHTHTHTHTQAYFHFKHICAHLKTA